MSFKGTAELIPIPRPRQSHVLELMEDVPLAVIYLTSPEPASLPVFLVLVDDDVIQSISKTGNLRDILNSSLLFRAFPQHNPPPVLHILSNIYILNLVFLLSTPIAMV